MYEIIDCDMTASSTLVEAGYNYSVESLVDMDEKTCWAEGSEGDGIGEVILYTVRGNTVSYTHLDVYKRQLVHLYQ